MTPEQAVEFIRTHPRAVLATTRNDGGVQMSPVAVGVDDDGTLLISTRETAVKAKNLQRLPYAVVCVMSDIFYGEWLQAEGPVQLVSMPDALPALERYYRST